MNKPLRPLCKWVFFFVLLGIVATSSLMLACDAAPQSFQQVAPLPLAGEIKTGSIDAILKAGASGDKRYLPLLRGVVGQGLPILHSASGSAQMAMAKLGDSAQMKSVVCELSYAENRVQDEAIEKLKYIGGYGSIKALASLLIEDQRNNQMRWDPLPTDIKPGEKLSGRRAAAPLSRLAMKALSTMVVGPALPSPTNSLDEMFPTDKERETWRKWLSQNDAKLKTLEPRYLDLDIRPKDCLRQEQEEQKALDKKHKESSDENKKNK